MDKVRLGRALGYGTRHAAKTLVAVAEAAVAPSADMSSGASHGRPPQDPPLRQPAEERGAIRQRSAPADTAGRRTASAGGRGGVVSGTRAGARGLLAPLRTFSGALWLRVTGTFFAVLAMAMLSGAWRLRSSLGSGVEGHPGRELLVFAGFGALFGYFAVSSFVRASLRERRG